MKWVPPFAFLWILLVVVLLACAFAGCGQDRKPAAASEPKTGPDKVTEIEKPVLEVIPGSEKRSAIVPLQEEYRHLDAAEAGWDTETLGETAKSRLKSIIGMLEDADGLDPSTLEDLVGPVFRCTPLRPPLTEVFRDPALTVWRPEAGALDGNATIGDVSGLARTLRTLAEPFRGATAFHKEAKVFHVRREGGELLTRAYVRAIATGGENGARQFNATWACRWVEAAKTLRLKSIEVEEYEEISARGGDGGTLFSDSTASVFGDAPCFARHLRFGIDHWRNRLDAGLAPFIAGYNGLAVGDANGDGLDDVYICQDKSLPNRLLIRNPDGTVTDRAPTAGVDFVDASSSALFVDLDNDGDQDLIIGGDGPVLCLENDGSARFKVRARIPFGSFAFSMAAADYDEDGLVDFYVAGHTSNEASQRESVLGVPVPVYDGNNGQPNVLVKNLGGWKFRDVTREVGLDENNTKFSLSPCWEDFDNDGDLDLCVANDFGRNNLYRNQRGDDGKVRFEDVAGDAGVEDVASGMSTNCADYDHDGYMDLYIGNMFSGAGSRVTYQRRFRPGSDAGELARIRRMARGNSLFRNSGGGTLAFRDVSIETGTTMGRWAWTSKFADINNDSWDDLVIANGFYSGRFADDL